MSDLSANASKQRTTRRRRWSAPSRVAKLQRRNGKKIPREWLQAWLQAVLQARLQALILQGYKPGLRKALLLLLLLLLLLQRPHPHLGGERMQGEGNLRSNHRFASLKRHAKPSEHCQRSSLEAEFERPAPRSVRAVMSDAARHE